MEIKINYECIFFLSVGCSGRMSLMSFNQIYKNKTKQDHLQNTF